MSKHTPGPWHVHQRWAGFSGTVIRAGETNIADLRINGTNQRDGESNARLIAAAPDLLAALLELRAGIDELEGPGARLMRANADEVIAKATGK